MGWILFVAAGVLMLAGARLLLGEARRAQGKHRDDIATRFGFSPYTESGFGLHGFGAHEPGGRLIHAGRVGDLDVAILWDVDVPLAWLGDRYHLAVVVKPHVALPESSFEKAPGSALQVTGDGSWLHETLKPVLEAATHWFRVETAGDQLIVMEHYPTKRTSVEQVARMLVMAFGVLRLPTDHIEVLAGEEPAVAVASHRLVAGYSLVALSGLAMLVGIGVS